jgi:carbohydrate ABC transporter membrane protein 1, CUT1 family (TC 3.A.1.1.-)
MVPAIILMLIFLIGPILYSLYGSLTNQALTGYKAANPQFVGLQNYVTLFSSPDFWKSIWLTVIFVFFSAVVGQNILGMAIAMLMRAAPPKVSSIIGGIVIIAWVLPEIVAAFALYAFFSTEGTLNRMLAIIGLSGPTWLLTFPMFSVIMANIWRGTAFSMMVYGAALGDVPPDVTEAAMIDGASGRQRILYVTLPMIKGSISTNLLLTTLQTLATFTLIWVMTGGGPGTKSSTLPVLAYQQAFKFSQVGYGTAIATVTLFLGALFALVYIRVLKPEVD